MSADYQLEDTIYKSFTTRAFATGIPTTLAGTPAIDIYEDDTATPIVTGETVSIDHNSVTGLNVLTITATAASGFNLGGSYFAAIQAGTVGGVSVVGEVVAEFTLDNSAAAKDLANATDGLSALKALIDALNDFNPDSDDVAVVTLVGTTSVNTDTAATLGTPANIDSGGATIADNLKKLADDNDGADFDAGTDSQQKIRDRGDAAWTTGAGGSDPQTLISTTIATLASQVSFTLTAGSTDDDAYNKAVAVITDVSTAVQKAFMDIEDYVGSTKTVTLRADPGIFTMAATDNIDIIVGVTAEQLIAEHFGHITEDTETFEEQQRLIRSATVAKLGISGNDNSFRDAADTKDRIVSTTDVNGQRTTVVVDGA